MSKKVTMELKLRKNHPRKSYRLGTHVIGVKFAKFELSEDEVKELKGKGPSVWVISKDQFDAMKKKKVPAKKES